MAKSIPILIVLSFCAAWAVWAETSPLNIEKALEAQLELVSERPYDAPAHNDLGNLLSLTGRLDEAETAYRRAKELDVVDPSIRFNLGLLLQQAGRLEDANQEYYSLLELEPENAWAHYQLGVVAFTQGKTKQAKELYARSFALDPTLSFPRHNPHVIDNPVATEALLLSSRYLSNPTARVPRQYAEAGRIADLMLAEDSEAEQAEAEQAEAEEDSPPEPSRELLDEQDDPSRVLTNEDLEGLSQVGQAGGRNARRGARGGNRGSSRYSSGRKGGSVKREKDGSREQDPRSRYRPRSSDSRNRSLERDGSSGGGFTTVGRAGASAPTADSEGRGNTLRPEVGRPLPGRPIAGNPRPGRPGSSGGGTPEASGGEPFRPGTGSTASLRLELLDEATGP